LLGVVPFSFTATEKRRTGFLILSFIETHRNKEQSEKDRKLNRFLGIKVVIMAKIAL